MSARDIAELARETRRLAGLAGDATARGIEATTQVLVQMDALQDDTRRIRDIVAVIDSIALQTNILALNAAVEAARAGEQGRGFAVVASEVRALSIRCADSARQIKAVAAAASARVEQSSAEVDRVAESIADINGNVGQVNRLMDEVLAGRA